MRSLAKRPLQHLSFNKSDSYFCRRVHTNLASLHNMYGFADGNIDADGNLAAESM